MERIMSFFNKDNTIAREVEIKSNHVDYLDGWRGVAIAIVLVHHFYLIEYPKIGRLGVDIFFVLSGLLMSRILFVKKTPLSIFYKRRASRILPVFILYVGLVFLIASLSDVSFAAQDFVSTLLFLRTYIPSEPHMWVSQVPIGHLWSLNIEEHFYLLLSLVTVLPFSKKGKGFLLLFFAFASIGMIIFYLRHKAIAPINYILRTECATTCLLLSSGYFLLKDAVIKFIRPWLPPITFFAAIFCYTGFAPWYASFLFAPFLLAFTVNHLEESADMLKKILSIKVLQLLGIWSYSIYLWQQLFYSYQSTWPLGTAFAAAMLLGIISFYFYEKPTRKWLNNFSFSTRQVKFS
jgi:peptidoglycan/LPS O-acetylase OafA/YrhL